MGGVLYRPLKYWKVYEETTRRRMAEGDTLNIVYYQTWKKLKDVIDPSASSISFRYAVGFENTLKLEFHEFFSDALVINLETGEVFPRTTPLMVKLIHGGIMITAWSLCSVIAIMVSSYRFLLENKGKEENTKWFKLHRGAGIAVVLLGLVGFGAAIWMVEDKECALDDLSELQQCTHFASLHQQLGLGVIIVSVFLPLTALVRPQPATNKEPKKTTLRLLWEITHKLLGYAAWITSQYVVYLGVDMLSKDMIYKFMVIGWAGFVVLIYLILWMVKCAQPRLRKQKQPPPALVDQMSVEMGAQFSPTTGTPIQKQTTFVEEEDLNAPKTSGIR